MLKADEVRSKLRDVIVGSLPVRDFDLWISDASWDAHRLAEPSASEMIDGVQMRLAEYFNSDAQRNLDDLKHDLIFILNNIVIEVNDAPSAVRRRTAISLPMHIPLALPSFFSKIPQLMSVASSNAIPALELDLKA